MSRLEKYREFALNVSTGGYGYDFAPYQERAKELLDNDFEEETIETFEYYLDNIYNYKENRECLKRGNKIEIVNYFSYSIEIASFIEKYWNKLDDAIKVLQEYLNELEQKEAKDNE